MKTTANEMALLEETLLTIKTSPTKAGKQLAMIITKNEPIVSHTMEFLFNKFKITGISTKKMSKQLEPYTGNLLSFQELLDYVVANPTGTDQTVQMVQTFISHYPEQQAIIEEIITKTLSLGVSAASVNKAYGAGFVPEFSVQLAYAHQKKMHLYCEETLYAITQKLDGYRAIVMVNVTPNGLEQTIYTRSGKEVVGANEMHEGITDFLAHNAALFAMYPDGVVFDGELLATNEDQLDSGKLYQKTSKTLQQKGEKKGLNFHIFDMIDINEFLYDWASDETKTQRTYQERRQQMDTLEEVSSVFVVPVLAWVKGTSEIADWMEHSSDYGWEGLMLNVADAYYVKKRTAGLLKVKEMNTADLEIIGFNQAINGENKGLLQSLVLRLDDMNTVNVGIGLSADLIRDIWYNQDKYLGLMVEVQYFEQTTNQNGGKSLRFPVFKGFRYDKTPEETSLN